MAKFWLGVGVGVALAYLLDPEAGVDRREALMRRLAGLRGDAAGPAPVSEPTGDDLLALRVAASLRNLVSHPRAITAIARGGTVTVRGPVLASEAAGLLAGLTRIQGVDTVVNELDIRATADVPALQTIQSPAG
jgi:hypothetical protein